MPPPTKDPEAPNTKAVEMLRLRQEDDSEISRQSSGSNPTLSAKQSGQSRQGGDEGRFSP